MNKQNTYSWATHQPLIKAVLEIYTPVFILELGIGMFSTPLFPDENYLGIENDLEWFKEMQGKQQGKNFIYYSLGEIKSSTSFNKLKQTEKENIISFYSSIKIPEVKGNRLLFIDGFVCTRQIAMVLLKSKFDVIIYHDAQPKSDRIYAYSKVSTKGFKKLLLTSDTSWTGILIRENLETPLQASIGRYIKEFKQEFKYIGKMKLING